MCTEYRLCFYIGSCCQRYRISFSCCRLFQYILCELVTGTSAITSKNPLRTRIKNNFGTTSELNIYTKIVSKADYEANACGKYNSVTPIFELSTPDF